MLNFKNYMMLPNLRSLSFFGFFCCLVACTPGDSVQENLTQPNILLILTDDQGYPTLGAYGGTIVKTPALDRLAEEGLRFTDAYVTSQCTPTRASLITGQYTARNGLWHVIGWYGYPWARMMEAPFREQLDRETFTLPKGLRAAGYETAIFGKWHLTTNEDGHYMGLKPEAAHHYGFSYAGPVTGKEAFAPGSDRGVRALTEQALGWIGEQGEKPWFCFLSHHMIHGKVVAPDSLVAAYQAQGYGNEGPNRAVYLAGLELIDWSVGELVAGLEKMGISDETLIVFISDNGGIDTRLDFKDLGYTDPEGVQMPIEVAEYDNAPLREGKGSIYEGGVRVPMILKWPGKTAIGKTVNTPVHIIDLAPTFLAAAGGTSTHVLDGQPLHPLFSGEEQESLANRPVFQYAPFYDLRWGLTPSASIRLGDYKLIEFFGDRIDENQQYRMGHHLELYNLREDVGETHNLAQDMSAIAGQLQQQLHDWIAEVGVPVPVENPNYDPVRAFEETREKPE